MNGQVGGIAGFQFLNDRIKIVYLKSDDPKIGARAMSDNHYAKQNSLKPIEKFEAELSVKEPLDLILKQLSFLYLFHGHKRYIKNKV